MIRISVGTACLAGCLSAALVFHDAAPAMAQAYPERNVQLIVPYPPGGGTDNLGRVVARGFGEIWDVTMPVENRGGASGSVGAQYVARMAPDGYTLLLAPNSYTINAQVEELPFDIVEDFAPVAMIATSPLVLAVNNSVEAETLQEFIDYAKANPGTLRHGTAGIATAPHLAGELFNLLVGVDILHVPYRGSGPVTPALLSNEVQAAFGPLNAIAGLIASGDVRVLAVLGSERYHDLPDIPTVAESGYPDYEVDLWYSLLAPAGTPHDILQKLSEGVRQVLELDGVGETLTNMGFVLAPSTPEELGAVIAADMRRWGDLLQEIDISIDH